MLGKAHGFMTYSALRLLDHEAVALLLVAQSCLTLYDPMDCSSPDLSIHGISKARILKYVAISFSKIFIPGANI